MINVNGYSVNPKAVAYVGPVQHVPNRPAVSSFDIGFLGGQPVSIIAPHDSAASMRTALIQAIDDTP